MAEDDLYEELRSMPFPELEARIKRFESWQEDPSIPEEKKPLLASNLTAAKFALQSRTNLIKTLEASAGDAVSSSKVCFEMDTNELKVRRSARS